MPRLISPAERLAAECPRKREPRNVPRPDGGWACKIRERRERLRLTLRSVAAAVGLSPTSLHHIELGGDVRLKHARKLSDFFGVTERDLWPNPTGADQ